MCEDWQGTLLPKPLFSPLYSGGSRPLRLASGSFCERVSVGKLTILYSL